MAGIDPLPLYLFFIVLPLGLPLVAGIIILAGYRKDELNRLMGLIAIKPVLAYPIWFYLMNTVSTTWYDSWLDKINGPLLPLIPAIMLSIVIVYVSRNMFAHGLAWLFLGLDILRMLNTFILASSDEMDDFSLWFGLLLPSAVAILALIIAMNRNNAQESSAAPTMA